MDEERQFETMVEGETGLTVLIVIGALAAAAGVVAVAVIFTRK